MACDEDLRRILNEQGSPVVAAGLRVGQETAPTLARRPAKGIVGGSETMITNAPARSFDRLVTVVSETTEI